MGASGSEGTIIFSMQVIEEVNSVKEKARRNLNLKKKIQDQLEVSRDVAENPYGTY